MELSITDADIIVAGGRGMGSAENFGLIRGLAGLLGAAVGASRVGAKSAPFKIRQLKMSCRILRLCSLAPPSLRPEAHRRGGADGKTIQSRPASEVTKSLVQVLDTL